MGGWQNLRIGHTIRGRINSPQDFVTSQYTVETCFEACQFDRSLKAKSARHNVCGTARLELLEKPYSLLRFGKDGQTAASRPWRSKCRCGRQLCRWPGGAYFFLQQSGQALDARFLKNFFMSTRHDRDLHSATNKITPAIIRIK